jgi:peptidoglycan DL-endopeptidase CwlO
MEGGQSLYVHRRRRRRVFRHRRGLTGRQAAAAILAGVAVAAASAHAGAAPAGSGTPGKAGAIAIGYAREQIGQPYLWGGTGPGGFDCSGLVMEAYASAGIQLERTSEQQWNSEHRVSTPVPGDLVFFAGSDGNALAPGHVGIVINPKTHTMIDAYATGWGVVVQTYGLPSSPGGDSPVVGFTDPAAS